MSRNSTEMYIFGVCVWEYPQTSNQVRMLNLQSSLLIIWFNVSTFININFNKLKIYLIYLQTIYQIIENLFMLEFSV